MYSRNELSSFHIAKMGSTTAPARPTTANWNMGIMLSWLQSLDDKAVEQYGKEAAWVCPNRVTWGDNDERKGRLKNQENAGKRQAITRIPNLAHHGAKTWLLFCDTPAESYVGIKFDPGDIEEGKKQWDLIGWHSWGMAIVNAEAKGSGKNIYLFDCDQALPNEAREKRVKDVTTQRLRVFFDALNERSRWRLCSLGTSVRLIVGRIGA